MIPSRALVLLFVLPLILGFAAAAEASLIWPMLATDGALFVAAGLDALMARRRLVTVTRTCDPVFSVGRQNKVRLEVRSLSRRKLRVQLRDDLFEFSESTGMPVEITVPPRGRASGEYRVVPTRRGSYELGDHYIRYRSPLGLWTRQIRYRSRTAVRIYPDVQAVRAYELMARQNRENEMVRATRLRGGESEFECLREYTRDDEFRSIDWKATAHKRKLISRQYQLERNQSVVFALDCGRLMTAKAGDLPLFDHALNSTLMLAHVAVRGGDHVGVFTFADDVRSYAAPISGAGAAKRIVRATFNVHPELTESNYQAAFLRVGSQLRKRSLIVIMTQVIDSTSASELVRVTRSLCPRHLPLCVIFRDPELEGLARPAAPGSASLYSAAAAAELLWWRQLVMRDLKKAGALVLDIEPRELTPALIGRYLDIKVRHLL